MKRMTWLLDPRVAVHAQPFEERLFHPGESWPIYGYMNSILIDRPAAGSAAAFQLEAAFEPAGDQPEAIEQLKTGLREGEREQVLLGVTGSGKTFTMAQVIRDLGRPALILAPNKTLAAQLYGEMKSFFPHNAVEYFVSYDDYYQPES